MIRINLLPKEFEKKAAAKKRGLMIGSMVGFIIVFFIGVYILRVVKVGSLKSRIEEVERELAKLKPVVQKVGEIQSKKEELNKKIGVIKNLMKSRLLYPIFMEDFAAIIPKKVWMTSLNTQTKENSLSLNFNVIARDNYAVADFINVLEISKKFDEIKFSGINTMSFEGEEVRTFNISCAYYPTGEPPRKEVKKPVKKKRRKRKRRR